jgi:S-adenosylmethionine:tRNA ribosyltransferase-isomerase
MDLSDFEYHLPEGLIAQFPLRERGQSRLLVLRRDTSHIEHRRFSNLADYLRSGDCLVVNETKVLPARLIGEKEGTGGKVELLLVRDLGDERWHVLVKPSRRARIGARYHFGTGRLLCELEQRAAPGLWVGKFQSRGKVNATLAELGQVPLPPYIRRPPEPSDTERYQTVFARHKGAVAAPTAGLHFTRAMLKGLEQMGVEIVPILLHVGPGTFRPVKQTEIRRHRVEAEYYRVSRKAAETVNRVKKGKGRIVAVGTTTVRVLESSIVWSEGATEAQLQPGHGWTDLFIYPPFRFRMTDVLLTNFHLPRSTLLMLVSAFAGHERILQAYREAIQERYRFYSYGDAMVIL